MSIQTLERQAVKGVYQGVLPRKGILSVEEGLAVHRKAAADRQETSGLHGALVRVTSKTIKTFVAKGCICVSCGLQAAYFAIERVEGAPGIIGRWRLNLYGVNENDEEVLMTKDHIIPRSRGGKNVLQNFQPMCYICNHKKKNYMMKEGKQTMQLQGEEKVRVVFRKFEENGSMQKGEQVVLESELEEVIELLTAQGFSILRQQKVSVSCISLFCKELPQFEDRPRQEIQVMDLDGQLMLRHYTYTGSKPTLNEVMLDQGLNASSATVVYNDYIEASGLPDELKDDISLYYGHSFAALT